MKWFGRGMEPSRFDHSNRDERNKEIRKNLGMLPNTSLDKAQPPARRHPTDHHGKKECYVCYVSYRMISVMGWRCRVTATLGLENPF